MKRRTRILAVCGATLAFGAAIYLYVPYAPQCSLAAGWARSRSSCECIGIEWYVERGLAYDGNDRSVCLGYVRSYQED